MLHRPRRLRLGPGRRRSTARCPDARRSSKQGGTVVMTLTAGFTTFLVLNNYLRLDIKPEVAGAEATGFEPAISALTGLHVRPLHHASRNGCGSIIAYLLPSVKIGRLAFAAVFRYNSRIYVRLEPGFSSSTRQPAKDITIAMTKTLQTPAAPAAPAATP